MKHLFQYFRTHTFLRIVLTFVSILIASLTLVGGFSYYAYRSSLINTAVESGRTSVNFIMEQIDSEIQNLHYATLSILNNTTLQNFETFSKDDMPDSLFRLKKMMKEIVYLENSYPALASIWLYANDSQLFITRYGTFEEKDFLETQTKIDPISGQSIAQILKTASPFRYYGTSNISNFYNSQNCISFVRSVTDHNEKPLGQIIMNIESTVFSGVMDKASERDDLAILLLDEEDNVISSSGGGAEISEDIRETLSTFGTNTQPQSIHVAGKNYTGWITTSKESGLRYLSLIDQNILLKSVNYIRGITVGLVILCLLISAFLAFSLTNRLFAPIHKIIRYIQAEQGNKEELHDVFLIEKFIEYMKSKNAHLQECIENYTGIMQDAMITELLYSQEQQPMLELYQKGELLLPFPYEQFTVAIVPLRQPEQAGMLQGEKLQAVVKQVLEQIQGEVELDSWLILQQERLILVLNTNNSGKDPVHYFLDTLKTKYSGYLLYAYGKTYPSISGLYDSFHQAINILMVKPNLDHSEKEAYEEAINARYITSFYPQDVELKLMRQIKTRSSGDTPKAILQEILQRNKEDGASALRLESLFVQLIMTINRIIAEMNIDGGEIFGKDVNHYRVLDSFPTLEEKEQYVCEAFGKLVAYIRTTKPSKVSEIYQTMLDYVAERYMEDLSLNDISYQLKLSPSYLSSIFKECHHTTFLDYVNKYRSAKAKLLLLNSEDPIAVIAAKVGYSNVNTFIRIFKKEEGQTPGQYRIKGK